MNMAQIKNINNAVRDLQKQVSQLKNKSLMSNKKRGEYVLSCSTDDVAFKRYDICKVISTQASKFDGTEGYATALLPGIILNGNFEDPTGDVLVLINGTSYVKVSEAVSAGELLYPDSDDYTKGKTTGNVAFWKALEDADADDLVKVAIIYSSGTSIYDAKIVTVIDSNNYTADVYYDRENAVADESGVALYVRDIVNELAVDDWIPVKASTKTDILYENAQQLGAVG